MKIADKNLLTNQGQRLSNGMFVEYSYNNDVTPPTYTISREDREIDGVVYPSLFRLYMEADDVTEYEFVKRHLHDFKQWKMLCNNKLFKDEIAEWREELRLRKIKQAVAGLEEDAQSDSRSAKSSAKFLVERVYGLPKRSGRPAKPQTGRGAAAPSRTDTKEDFTRLFGNDSADK